MRHKYQMLHPDTAHKIKFYIGDVRNLESVRVATYFVCSVVPLTGVWGLLIRLAISVCIPGGLFILCFFKTHEFKESVCLL